MLKTPLLKFKTTAMITVVAALAALSSCKKNDDVQPLNLENTANITATSTATANIDIAGSGMVLGINGHPLGDDAYKGVTAATQIDLLKSMGMGIYRINILSQSDGTCTVPKVLTPLLEAAANGKVTLLPMLTPRTLNYSVSEADAYAAGKTLGANFASKYAANFKYYDLGNDLDVKSILSGKDGKIQADYDQKKLHITAAYLKGMNDGIKSNDADAQTMISAGWVHWGFIQFCESYGVKFDILAYHWYSDMEEVALRSTSNHIEDITVKLNSLFPGKPIWITETNARPKDVSIYEAYQNTFLTSFINKCKANPTVKALLIYELFNEPYKSAAENNYGVTNWVTPYTKWSNKVVANTLIQANSALSTAPVTTPTVPVTTPTVPVTTPTVPVTALITNITATTGKKYQLSKLTSGAVYYTDRTYDITSAPSYLVNAPFIQTANEDKINTSSSLLSFNLNHAGTVYVAYDPRATTLPTWLQGWKKLTDKIGINDSKISSFNLYSKDFPAGKVTLGGNMAGAAAGALCQYVVIAKTN
jgi:hypothetical protein